MPDHILSHENRQKFSPVVHCESQSHKFGQDGGPSGPRLDNLPALRFICLLNLPQEMIINERSFF